MNQEPAYPCMTLRDRLATDAMQVVLAHNDSYSDESWCSGLAMDA